MTTEDSLIEIKKEWHGSLGAYLTGFFVCVLLTGASFTLVITNMLEKVELCFTIVALAFVQALVQLLCFLHLGREAKPRWETFI
ncbi:MAG: cytochrome C oxidase subunit IV family protein, partial [Verrucomicrobia bacterium]|nr:cytochrome C oxidase subunit IV family protein [Verrucomicrobiota bacterium]